MMSDITLAKKITHTFEGNPNLKQGVTTHIENNLNSKFELRPYQIEAFKRFDYYNTNYPKKPKPIHLMFHMATGSGKTLIMAGLILDLYEKGYRNFIFFVHSKAIIEKTRDNFLNPVSSKYLFNDTISISDQTTEIKEVENFEAINDEDINIVFTTIQGLHTKLNTPRENSLTVEDFEDKKIVLLSDEAHHINAETKKGKKTKQEVEAISSWECTVNKIFKSNPNNYLLEFTATIDLKNPEIRGKYNDKIIFDYQLKEFREDLYSKEVKVLQADMKRYDRALQAVLLSQYRRKVFAHNKLQIKPVILFKSKTIKESKTFYNEFLSGINNLTSVDLEKINNDDRNLILKKVFNYFDSYNITLENLVLELKDEFSENKCISVDSKNDSEEKQLLINSLEDENNEIRAVFAVDKLNEGWDVLNLFDIVRLYNTRDANYKTGKVGKTTMSEAQLIGRGARYCPFKISEDQSLYQRKYDSDIENDLRICEELYYHSAHNPEYISELKKTLIETGIIPKKTIEKKLVLKNSFKKSELYNYGVILVNERREIDRKDVPGLDQKIINEIYQKKFKTKHTSVQSLTSYTSEGLVEDKTESIKYKFTSFSHPIIRKALNKLPFYRFSNLKKYFPNLNSTSEFINGENYLKEIEIKFIGSKSQVKNPSPDMKLEASITALNEISKLIKKDFSEFRGTETFKPKAISNIFGGDKEGKTLKFSIDDSINKETGIPQINAKSPELRINLKNEDWYAFNENYGTSEEKYLVKFVKEAKDEFLKNKNFYLIRNQKHFKVYTFNEGLGFEPDFVMFVIEKNEDKTLYRQIFIEPKGEHLLGNDDSNKKKNFLCQLREKYEMDVVFENKEFRLIGMPLFNEKKKEQFEKEFKRIFQDTNTS